jgi:hypothetical protein
MFGQYLHLYDKINGVSDSDELDIGLFRDILWIHYIKIFDEEGVERVEKGIPYIPNKKEKEYNG